MTFDEFKTIVAGYFRKAGISVPAKARKTNGCYIVQHDDITITGNSVNRTLTVRYGSGHQMMKRLGYSV